MQKVMAARILGTCEGFAACDGMITFAISVVAAVQPDVLRSWQEGA